MAYTDRAGKTILNAFGVFQVAIADTVVPGDLIGPSTTDDAWILADEDEPTIAHAVAITAGVTGDVISAALAVNFQAPDTETDGVWTAGTLAAAGDVGTALYLSATAGKAAIAQGGTTVQLVGYITSISTVFLSPGQFITGVSQTLSGALTVGGVVSLAAATTIAAAIKLQFRDTGIFIHSSADGKLTISADGAGLDDIILTGMVQPSRAVLPANVQKATLTDVKTLADTDIGVVQVQTVDAKTITLPSTVVGYSYAIMNGGADAAVEVTVAPAALDKVYGNGFTATDNKAIVNTKATAKKGDYIKLVGDGVNGWMITEINGIWARA
jgi:hypothetical protein